MTRIPAPAHYSETADQQIDTAVRRLVDLLARQAAAELCANVGDPDEELDADDHPQK